MEKQIKITAETIYSEILFTKKTVIVYKDIPEFKSIIGKLKKEVSDNCKRLNIDSYMVYVTIPSSIV